MIKELYTSYLREAGGKKSKDLFYTAYTKREVLL
jgi:hypothetical protein